MAEGTSRPAWAEIDLDALSHNVSVMAGMVAPARVCAVVKADGYGHGALDSARAALRAGATELAVALVEEGVELREAGIAAPVLVLSEPEPGTMAAAVRHGLTPTLYTRHGVAAAGVAAAANGRGPWAVEVKLDTGMHRVGTDIASLPEVAGAVASSKALSLQGLWTHLAVADEPGNPFTTVQLERFEVGRKKLAAMGISPRHVHAANSAGAIAWPESRLDLVRCGISLYGYPPSPAVAPLLGERELRPVLALKSLVVLTRLLDAGERLSYGLVRPLERRSLVATVPIGYADGVPRSYFEKGGEVLVKGRRRLLAGTVTMDQIIVDCGEDDSVRTGDEVVLLGRQAGSSITAEEWARRLGTISYEVVSRIGPRVPRVPVRRATRVEGPTRQ